MLYDLRQDQWEIIKHILPWKSGDRGRSGYDNRFIRAVMWIARTGTPWRAAIYEVG
jgi:transposase